MNSTAAPARLARSAEILRELISRPTVNPMERPYHGKAPVERSVVEYLEGLFRPFGVPLARQQCSPIHESLLITVPGRAPDSATLFESHIDTVPADDWADTAFQPRVDGPRIVGRGACDDKGSLAGMVEAVLRILESGERPPHPVLLLAAGDEECGQTGIKHFAKTASPYRVGRAVFGEPTGCLPIIQHKGTIRWDLTVRGRSSHSSQPEKGRSAILDMVGIIEELSRIQHDYAAGHRNDLLTPPTITVTMIHGGQTRNAIPFECTAAVDFRIVPGMNCESASQEVIAAIDRLGLATSHGPFQCFAPPLNTAPDDPFVQTVCGMCARILERPVSPQGVPYGSDASYCPGGVPTIVLGPGDIGHAHAVEESVDLREVEQSAEIYYAIMRREWEQPS